MIRNSKWTAYPFALGLFLIACQTDDPQSAVERPIPEGTGVEGPASPDAAYLREYAALKAKGLDPQAMGRAISGLAERYGYHAYASAPDGEDSREVPAEVPGPEAGLGKAAAGSKYVLRKSRRIRTDYGFLQSFLVPAGKTIKADAFASSVNYDPYAASPVSLPPADPFLVGFTQTAGNGSCCSFKFGVVGFSDDIDAASSNFDGAFSWTNNSNDVVQINVAAFVYSTQTPGFMTLRVRIGSGGVYSTKYNQERYVNAAPVYDNLANTDPNCTVGPSGTLLRLSKNVSNTPPAGFAVLGVNAQTMRGAMVAEEFSSLVLDETLPGGYSNLLVGMYIGVGRVPTPPANSYLAQQYDLFSCPN
jgi:hypothetical protein